MCSTYEYEFEDHLINQLERCVRLTSNLYRTSIDYCARGEADFHEGSHWLLASWKYRQLFHPQYSLIYNDRYHPYMQALIRRPQHPTTAITDTSFAFASFAWLIDFYAVQQAA